ncbi:MAG: UTP--glucose-1-phosphate uridylyltransferase [Pseudomonadota bacterium]
MIENMHEKHVEFLKQHHFNEKDFNNFVESIKSGEFSKASNIVKGKISLPDFASLFNCQNADPEKKEKYSKIGINALIKGELACAIMNGGMATRFGGVVKGLVPVYDGLTFLEIKLQSFCNIAKKYEIKLPVYLMNSFSTDNDTLEFLEKKGYFNNKYLDIKCFNQSISLRLNQDGSMFYDSCSNPIFFTPGHGDFSIMFKKSGMFDDFSKKGCKYLFLSNVDNLVATLDPLIVGSHINSCKAITCESVEKLEKDAGGAPVIVNDRLQILEDFRFPEGFDKTKIPIFNTNTFIFSKSVFESKVDLTWFYVEKKIDGNALLQCERLVGELTSFFDTNFIIVPRFGKKSRFYPLKTPQDLEKCRLEIKDALQSR